MSSFVEMPGFWLGGELSFLATKIKDRFECKATDNLTPKALLVFNGITLSLGVKGTVPFGQPKHVAWFSHATTLEEFVTTRALDAYMGIPYWYTSWNLPKRSGLTSWVNFSLRLLHRWNAPSPASFHQLSATHPRPSALQTYSLSFAHWTLRNLCGLLCTTRVVHGLRWHRKWAANWMLRHPRPTVLQTCGLYFAPWFLPGLCGLSCSSRVVHVLQWRRKWGRLPSPAICLFIQALGFSWEIYFLFGYDLIQYYGT